MIMTESGLVIPASEVAYVKDGYAYLWCGAKIKIAKHNCIIAS